MFGPYTALWQRERSIGYDWVDGSGVLLHHSITPDPDLGHFQTNRSFVGRTHGGTPEAVRHLEQMAANTNDVPLVFILDMANPAVPAEFEPISEAILVGTEVSAEAFIAVISGKFAPTGLLPVTLPVNMATVELSYEDAPHDMVPYFDSEGNHYAFGFGLTFGPEGGTLRIGVDTEDSRFDRFVTNNKYVLNGNIFGHDLLTFPRSEIRPLLILSAQAAELLNMPAPAQDPAARAMLQLAYNQAVAIIGVDPPQYEVDEVEQLLREAIRGYLNF